MSARFSLSTGSLGLRALLVAGMLGLLALRGGPLHARVAQAGGCAVTDPQPMAGLETAMVDAINEYRTSLGLPALVASPLLTTAARWKSQARSDGAPEAHDDPDRAWHERLNDCGYTFPTEKGEN